jgi:BirA family biotin operon repressor/biotin-[acetyl-CoA-carboxylase] ligase
VLVDGRKVCGILVESPGGASPAKNRLVVGVGINVNNSWCNAPRDVGSEGAALCDIAAKYLDPQELLIGFLSAFDRRLKQLAAKDPQLPQAWQQLCWLTDQDVAVASDGRAIEGRCLGIADDGALLVKTSLTTDRIYSGSVRLFP